MSHLPCSKSCTTALQVPRVRGPHQRSHLPGIETQGSRGFRVGRSWQWITYSCTGVAPTELQGPVDHRCSAVGGSVPCRRFSLSQRRDKSLSASAGADRGVSLPGKTRNQRNSKNTNSVFSEENNSMSMSFSKKVSHSIGDYKNVKTGQQCMSLMEKNWISFFFSFPNFRLLLFAAWLQIKASGQEGRYFVRGEVHLKSQKG